MEKLMTYKEVAIQLGVSLRYVAKLVRLGDIPFFKIGKSVRFHPTKIREWLEKKGSARSGSALSASMVSMRKRLTIVKVKEGVA